MKVKDLPVDARCAFQKFEGGQPAVDFMGGKFFSVEYPRDQWGFPDPVRIERSPGDWLVEDENLGIKIIPADQFTPQAD